MQLHPDFLEPLGLKEVSAESFFTYVVLTYDIESPYVLKYNDWAQRRRETAKASNFKVVRGEYVEEVEQIILGKNERINKIMLRYMFLQNDIEFIQFNSYQALYFRQSMDAMFTTYKQPSHYDSLKKNIDILASEIRRKQKEIFNGTETISLKRSLYEFVSNLTYDFKPEDIAEKIENALPIVDVTPYPKDYIPKKMTFNGDE